MSERSSKEVTSVPIGRESARGESYDQEQA
jgi:hypothetical protein